MSIEAGVKSIIVDVVHKIRSDSTVHAAAALMVEKDIGCLVVADDDGPVGMVTERDILRKVTAVRANPSKVQVGSIMSSPVVFVAPDASIGEAARKMVENKVKRLVVMDENGKFLGLVTMSDVVGWLAKQEEISDSLITYLMHGEL